VLNSVLLDGVVVGDNATVQGSVLAAGVVVKERASLKDCQVVLERCSRKVFDLGGQYVVRYRGILCYYMNNSPNK
jgi:ADP-glucose pyrophosphorylase